MLEPGVDGLLELLRSLVRLGLDPRVAVLVELAVIADEPGEVVVELLDRVLRLLRLLPARPARP
jgi:hypothetical protein